eukprot:gene10051-11122_t
MLLVKFTKWNKQLPRNKQLLNPDLQSSRSDLGRGQFEKEDHQERETRDGSGGSGEMTEVTIQGRFQRPSFSSSSQTACLTVFPTFIIETAGPPLSVVFVCFLFQPAFQPAGCLFDCGACMAGRFSNDLVHGRRLFLANTLTLQAPRAIVLPTQCDSPSHSLARGWVDFCSDPMRLVDGFVVFLAIKEEVVEGEQEGRLRHLLLSKDALGLAPYLCLGRHVVVQKAKVFSWQGGGGGMGRQGSPSWLLVTSASSLLLGEVRSPSPHICSPPSPSLEEEETVVEREVCLHGSVQSLQAGWLTLRLSSSDPKAPSCHIFFSHLQRSSLSVQWYALGAGAEVVFHRLLPIVLHGRLSGYSYTPRSSLSLLAHASKDAETSRIKHALEAMPRFLRHCGLVVSAWRREVLQRLLAALDRAVLPNGLLAALDQLSHKELLSWSEATKQMLKDPLQRVVQEEVVDSWRCALHTLRGGLDGDYLSSLLPRVATVSTVDRLSRSLPSANRKGLCMTVDFDLHYLPASSDMSHDSLPFDVLVGRLVEVRYVSGMAQLVVSCPTSGSLVLLLLLACPSDDSRGFRFVVKEIQLPTTNALLWIRRLDVVVMCGAEGRRETCLLAHPSQVTLFPLDQPLRFVPSAVERMPFQATSCGGGIKGLREVLTTQLGAGGSLYLDCSIMAVVLCRRLHLQDHGETSNSRKRSREPRVVTGWKQEGEDEDVQGRVDLLLCDLRFPDTIHFYLSSSESAGLMPGMIISLHCAVLCCPQKQRKLYLRTASTSMSTKTAVLGLLDEKGLQVCSTQSRVWQSFVTKIVDRIGLSPYSADLTAASISLPVCNLSVLAATRQWDRRLHRVLLSIATLRKLQCFLRCHVCFRVAATSTIALGNYYCPTCESSASILPVMEVSLLVEDGSADAMLKVEGSEATAALLQNLWKDPRGLAWAAVREAVEKEVWTVGRFVYDYADNCAGDGGPEDDLERILIEAEGEGEGAVEQVSHDVVCHQTYSALVRGAYLQRPVEAVRSYFRLGLPRAQVFEALVRLESFRPASTLLPPGEGALSGKKSRTIRLQEVNHRCKHRVQHCLLNTWRSERMELMAVEVKPLRDQQTVAETAYDLLATL